MQMHLDSLTHRREFILHRYFQEELDKPMDSSRTANNVQNHTISNNMAEAAGLIELFLDTAQSEDPKYSVLHSATARPQRGMRACRHRQAYVPMAANENELALEPERLTEFVGELVAGAGMQAQVNDCVLLLDATLCILVLNNAFSNASWHGTSPESAIELAVATTPTGVSCPRGNRDGARYRSRRPTRTGRWDRAQPRPSEPLSTTRMETSHAPHRLPQPQLPRPPRTVSQATPSTSHCGAARSAWASYEPAPGTRPPRAHECWPVERPAIGQGRKRISGEESATSGHRASPPRTLQVG